MVQACYDLGCFPLSSSIATTYFSTVQTYLSLHSPTCLLAVPSVWNRPFILPLSLHPFLSLSVFWVLNKVSLLRKLFHLSSKLDAPPLYLVSNLYSCYNVM